MALQVHDANAFHLGDGVGADDDRAVGAGEGVGKVVETELPVVDLQFARDVDGGVLVIDLTDQLHPPAAHALGSQAFVGFLDFVGKRTGVGGREGGDFQIVAGQRGDREGGRRVGSITVDVGIDVEPVAFELAAEGADGDSFFSEDESSGSLPQMNGFGRAEASKGIGPGFGYPTPRGGGVELIVKPLRALVLFGAHPFFGMDGQLDVAESNFDAERFGPASDRRGEKHFRHVHAALELVPFAPGARLGHEHGFDVGAEGEVAKAGHGGPAIGADGAIDAGPHGSQTAALESNVVFVGVLGGREFSFHPVPADEMRFPIA